MRCALCGKPLSRRELGKYKAVMRDGSEHPICRDCEKEEIRKGVKKTLADQGKLKGLKEQSLQGTEQTPPKPRKTEVGPPEAVIGEKIKAIEQELVLIRSQITGFMETLKTLGYDLSAIKQR